MRRVLLQMGVSLGIVAGGPATRTPLSPQDVKAWKAFPTGTVSYVYRLAGSTSR
jgi:hypothetical protein